MLVLICFCLSGMLVCLCVLPLLFISITVADSILYE
uniref:Uncharacterized protein n=1 Tax=Arundo donax TaxID=35708 RepID=A0A0A9A470_ARUDO